MRIVELGGCKSNACECDCDACKPHFTCICPNRHIAYALYPYEVAELARLVREIERTKSIMALDEFIRVWKGMVNTNAQG